MTLTLVYAGLGVLGLNWAVVPGAGSPLWPAAGVGVAGLMLGGLRLWPGVFLGRLLTALVVASPQPLWTDALISAGNAGATAAAVWLVQRSGGLGAAALHTMRGLLRFILYGGGVTATGAAAVGTLALVWSGAVAPERFVSVFLTWLVGSFTGVLIVAPLALAWRDLRPRDYTPGQAAHLAASLLACAVVSAAVFLGPDNPHLRPWTVFPVLVWPALAFNVRGASAALVIVSVLAAWGTAIGSGPFQDWAVPGVGRVVLMQEFIGVAALTILLLATAAHERREKEALRRSESRVRRVLDQLFAFVGITSLKGQLLEANRAPVEAAGLRLEDMIGKPFWDTYWWSYSSDVQAQLRAAVARARACETVRYDVPIRIANDSRMTIDFQISPLLGDGGVATDLVVSGVDVTPRIATERRLRETERRLNAVLNNASVAIFVMDERQHCSYMNAAAERLTGYALEEARGRPLHEVVHHTRPDGSHYPLNECPIDRAFPKRAQVTGEEVFVHKDGRFYPVAFTASPIQDESSQTVGTILEVRDISGEKRAEEARSLLMREVDHRARNTLAVVQSIVQLTRSADLAAYQEAVLGRVGALARAQTSLAERRWEGASLRSVLVQELSGLVDAERFRLSGPDVLLSSEQVQPVSMIVHELRTNAIKHGALSNDEGAVRVRWRTRGVDLVVTWTERGGPAVSPERRAGFGSRMIEQLARQVQGRVVVAWRPEGLALRLEFPLTTGLVAAVRAAPTR